jgi:hypothetical protein
VCGIIRTVTNYMRLWLIGLVVGVLSVTGCQPDAPPSPTPNPDIFTTQDAGLQPTLQADIQATAAAFEQTPAPTAPAAATLPAGTLEGTPIGQRTGDCPQPEGYELHFRQGFCVAAPTDWTILNVDGGLAAFWGTTPGRAIGIQPAWAAEPEVCELTIYIAPAPSASVHLASRFEEFQNRATLDELAPETIENPEGLAILGFRWQSGERGGAVYAGDVGQGRIVHISRTGTDCPRDAFLPIIDTLRINTS